MGYEPYYGEIMMWAGNYAPEGWAFCNGQILSIVQNTPLFALIGTTYGGDGINTFRLPDLRGRVPMGMGSGLGLTPRYWGDYGGAESQSVNVGQTQQVTQGDTGDPVACTAPPAQSPVTVPTLPPYQVVNFVIALQGYWPSRQ